MIVTIAFVALISQNQGPRQAAQTSTLDQLRETYVRAYNAGDAAAMQPLYVDSAVRMPYDAPAQVGRPAVLDGYRKSFASRRLDPTLRLVPSSVNLSGARATEWGLYHETLVSRSNGPSLHEDGKYMMLAERDATGGWRYAWSMFNRDSAAVVTRLATSARIQAAACTTPEYRQFDFWVGDWDVFGPAGARTGTNRVDRLLNGCVLQEHWVGAGGTSGQSFNTYVRSTQRWHQTWVDDHGGMLLLDGKFDGGTMTLEGHVTNRNGATTLQRIRWSIIEGDTNRVRQLWESSPDSGKTWRVAFDGTYVRKVSR